MLEWVAGKVWQYDVAVISQALEDMSTVVDMHVWSILYNSDHAGRDSWVGGYLRRRGICKRYGSKKPTQWPFRLFETWNDPKAAQAKAAELAVIGWEGRDEKTFREMQEDNAKWAADREASIVRWKGKERARWTEARQARREWKSAVRNVSETLPV